MVAACACAGRVSTTSMHNFGLAALCMATVVSETSCRLVPTMLHCLSSPCAWVRCQRCQQPSNVSLRLLHSLHV
jgi:hypothetical protein